jgi:PAS domain S-box-containing protein
MNVIGEKLSHFSPTFPRMAQILIVEDEYIIAANLQENLESLGYGVVGIESSAAGAIAKAAKLQPDLVLMDIRLQGEMDGIQAAQEIWNRLQIPVIYVTGHSDKSTLERAKVTFPFGYILKPVKERELYVAIETALNRYEREQFFSIVLRQSGDGIIIVDTQCRVKYLNRVAEVLTDWEHNEATDQDLMTVLNLIDEDTQQPIANPVQEAFQQQKIFYLNSRVMLITKTGRTLPVSDSVAPLLDNRGDLTGAVIMIRDDTPRRLQEEHNLAVQRAQLMERQMEELQQLNQLKDELLNTVSHELRTPLANIKMAIQMLEIILDQQMLPLTELQATARSQQMEKCLRILREQCDQELSLVNDLLELQRLNSGRAIIDSKPINILEWVPHIIETFQASIWQREQCLQVLLPPEPPPLVSDLTLFTHILRELLTNACKYTPPGEVITVSAQQVEERLRLLVSNSGAEIPPDELAHVFDKFRRIPENDRWNQGGTGLGLALVKNQVTYLGGTIRAESSAGQTCFIVELPLSPPDSTALESTALETTALETSESGCGHDSP